MVYVTFNLVYHTSEQLVHHCAPLLYIVANLSHDLNKLFDFLILIYLWGCCAQRSFDKFYSIIHAVLIQPQ